MAIVERLARLSDRMFDAVRDKRAFMVTEDDAVDGDFDSLRGQQYVLLVTFRRTGEAVPSPVWLGLDDQGHGYLKTAPEVGKVKRLRHDDRVLLAPCNARGKPTGQAVKGTGRVLPREEWPRAEAALAAAYGSGRKVFERVLGSSEDQTAYIEVRPARITS